MEQTKRSTNRGRCEHDAYPVEVLAVADGKKIALCLGCGRSGPVRGSSTKALMALRETPACVEAEEIADDIHRSSVIEFD